MTNSLKFYVRVKVTTPEFGKCSINRTVLFLDFDNFISFNRVFKI